MRLVAVAVVLLIVAAAARAEEPQWVHAIAMHGTPKYGPGFAHFDYVNPDAPKGGKVTLGAIGGFDSLNPFIARGEPADGTGGLYDTLTVAARDEPFTRYGLLAEAMRMPEDRAWIEFRLRPEARWHDGTPITAEDVVWTFDTLIGKGQPLYRFYYANVDRVTALDARTVRFDFKPGENRELPLIISEIAILPKHYWADRDFAATTLEPPLGSGPFRIVDLEANRFIEYERVADYWGRDLPANVGLNNFGRLRYDYYRDSTVAVEAFKAGAFDFRSENSSATWASGYDIPEVADGRIVRAEVPNHETAGMQGFVFNTRRALFEDRRVRRALAYAFDFEWSNRNLFHGQYTRTRSYFDNSDLAATGLPSAAELAILEPYRGRIPDQVFTTEYHPPRTAGDGRILGNLRVADRLLKEAGWVVRDKKRVHAGTGQPFAFEIMLVSPQFERIVLPMAKNMERLGLDVRVRTVDTAQYLERLRGFDYDMIVFNFAQSLSPGNEQRLFWGSAAADQPGSRNFIGIRDPVIDELIELVIAAPTREDLEIRCRALDRVLQWGHYLIPNFHITYDRLIYWSKFGHPPPTELRGAVFGAWWVDPDKAAALGN